MKKIQINVAKNHLMSVTLFLLEDEVASLRSELETVASNPSIHLTAQPCPYEGIEFLYRVPFEMDQQVMSADKSLYWHALPISNKIPKNEFTLFCESHYAMHVAVLEQDFKRVEKEKTKLLAYYKKYS